MVHFARSERAILVSDIALSLTHISRTRVLFHRIFKCNNTASVTKSKVILFNLYFLGIFFFIKHQNCNLLYTLHVLMQPIIVSSIDVNLNANKLTAI